jgi:hypothetical protein
MPAGRTTATDRLSNVGRRSCSCGHILSQLARETEKEPESEKSVIIKEERTYFMANKIRKVAQPKNPVTCQYCGDTFDRMGLFSHQAVCKTKTGHVPATTIAKPNKSELSCPKCKDMIDRRGYDKHVRACTGVSNAAKRIAHRKYNILCKCKSASKSQPRKKLGTAGMSEVFSQVTAELLNMQRKLTEITMSAMRIQELLQ